MDDRELDYKLLRSDYEDLEEVHNQSARIMKEYENRILDSQRTLPVLQELMSRLNVLDSRQIFSEITDVVADLLRTKTVAVYQKNGDYLRLLVAPKSTAKKYFFCSILPGFYVKFCVNYQPLCYEFSHGCVPL